MAIQIFQTPSHSKEYDLKNFRWPERYIVDASVARLFVDGVRTTHQEYWRMHQAQEDHLNGKKPKDPKKLKKNGQLWANNWNYGKAKAKIDRGTAENIKNVNDSLALSVVSFRRPEDGDEKEAALQFLNSPEMRGIVATKISTTFTDTLDREQRFTPFLNKVEYNSYAFGWCAITKDKDQDWLGTPHGIRDIGFKDRTKPEEVEGFVVFDTVDAKTLWRKWVQYKDNITLKSFEDADGNKYHQHVASGWVMEGLEEALFQAYNGKFMHSDKPTTHITSFEQILPDFVANPMLLVSQSEKVNISRIYNFEFEEGKFTVTYIAYGNNWVCTKKSNGCKGCYSGLPLEDGYHTAKFMLYQKTYSNVCQDDRVIIVQDSGFTTSGFIQDMRGIAKFAIDDSIRYNRKKNNIEDKLIFSGSPFFRQTTAQDGEQFRVTPANGFVVTNDGFDFLETQPRIDLQNHMLSLQMDEQQYLRDTIQYDAKLVGQLSSRPVKNEVEQKTKEINKIAGSKSDIKLRGYQRVFYNMIVALAYLIKNGRYKKLDKKIREGVEYFRDELKHELKDIGVEDDNDLVMVLEAIRDYSLEYTIGDTQVLKDMIALAETPYARRRLIRMLFLANGLPRVELNRLFPVITDDLRTFGDERVAAIENDLFMNTNEVVYSDRDDPQVHLDIHFQKVLKVFEQLNAGALDPVQGFNWAERILNHSQFHLAKMEQNAFYRQFFEDYSNDFSSLINALSQLRPQIEALAAQIAEQQRAAQQQNDIDPETQHKIQQDYIKLANSERINARRSEFRAQEKAKDAEFNRALKLEDHRFNKALQADMAELKKDSEMLKTSVDIAKQTVGNNGRNGNEPNR